MARRWPKLPNQMKTFVNKRVDKQIECLESLESDPTLKLLRQERNYSFGDEATISNEDEMASISVEHLHTDDEIRLFLEGSNYLDVRDKDDNWIRIEVTKGDLMIIPKRKYHKYSPGLSGYTKVRRLYNKQLDLVTYHRPAQNLESGK